MSEITRTDDIAGTEAAGTAENMTVSEPETPEEAVLPGTQAPEEAVPADTQTREGKKGRRSERPKKDKFEVTKDIWYRGPFSYRHLKIIGWLCIVIAQIGIVEGLKFRTMGTANEFFLNTGVMDFISSSALPLLLISVFAFLLKKRENYKSTLIVYGALALAIAGLFVLVYERYILGIAGSILGGERSDLAQRLDELLKEDGNYNGFLAFNIFIDVFICTLIMFFLDYEPRRFFTGKRLIFFRALVILPFGYEVACIMMKIMATDRFISLPMWISPFLTTKPPLSILMFLSIVRYIKIREKKFFATGRTKEQYEAFLKTNVNSLQFAKHLILIIVIYSALDILILVLLAAFHTAVISFMTNTTVTLEMVMTGTEHVSEWGFGGTARMIDLIPIVLLFSYTRSHKQPLIDTAIPIVGVAAIVIVYIDGIVQIIQSYLAKGMNSIAEILPVLEGVV